MTFLMEAIVFCLIFTLIVVPSVGKDPIAWIGDYPPAIRQRCRELGLIPEEQKGLTPAMILRKIIGCLAMTLLLALVLVYVNGATRFGEAFLLGYGLWLVVDWYDALVLDFLWMPNSKKVRIPGTEDMEQAYHDYGFHAKMSLVGMGLGLPVCLLAALLAAFIGG